ncbi:hypothetical protein BCR32DRAFT_291916 [Anaeromyces robustus]|uniref:ABC transporter domain-containing protein n=1 Tax=Anaeromyces robustus TaxID=1754192 RepID=A0A1Y1XCU9_9FUNG|nr:hypothetical protein BCR32DRAFT_291916 [Anaeromyces robustus]|eukprot:ORX83600.1 hypothetical protein BCR32DRAFT_291916 [Anaeromyces robustus]
MKKQEDNNSSIDANAFEIKLWDKEKINKKSGLWFIQFLTMLKKNFILQFRYWKTSLLISILTPLIAMILVKFIIILHQNQLGIGKGIYKLDKYPLSGIEDCVGPINEQNKCINLMFTNCIDNSVCQRDPNIDIIISNFVEANNKRMNLNWETDLSKWENWENDKLNFDIKERHNIIHVPNSDFIYNYSLNHQNITHFGIVFDIKNTTNTTNYRYQLWYNATLNYNSTDPFGSRVASVARGMDEAIVKFANGDPSIKPQFTVDLKDFPILPLSGFEDALVTESGPMFFFCVAMVIFINILSTIVSEKENRIRFSMEMMGLKQSVYWLSWTVIYVIHFFINSIATIIFGKLFNYAFFTNTNFWVLLIVFFVFGLAMGALAMFITTLVSRSMTAVLIGISFLIIGFLIQSFLFSDQYIAYIWWSTKVPQFIRKLFSIFLPFFNFGKLFIDISNLSSNSYNSVTNTVVKGTGFKWNDFFKKPSSLLNYALKLDYMEPTCYALYYLFANIVLYYVLGLYLDNILPNEYGNRKPFYYFLLPSYWFNNNKSVKKRDWVTQIQNKYPLEIDVKDLDDDVQNHYQYTYDESNNDPVKIINLRKVYGSGKKRKVAVKGSCLSIGQDKVVALLGQNGAGKSTTMNIISGLSPPSSGDILVYNKSVRKNPTSVQSELGICPQHDILYKDLTALEHLRLYSGIKGAKSCPELDDILINRLKAVQLYTVKDARAETYSGGMKRRLSMIIATIGDPNVILLDEPTTGMDPVNRRYVWQFIEKFKKDRCILLTTHSMEEADALGDDIVIMSTGTIKAIGNSIHLKNKFGNGYRISVLVDVENIDKFKAIASNMVPGIHIADDSAGALIYDFNDEQAQYVPDFVQYLDENPDNYVNTWGMSQTTLEEVFLYVIHEDSNRKIKEE